jgi:hypothetical protein
VAGAFWLLQKEEAIVAEVTPRISQARKRSVLTRIVRQVKALAKSDQGNAAV